MNSHNNNSVSDSKAYIAKWCLHGNCIYIINIQYLFAYLYKLKFQLEVYQSHVVLIQETWLETSTKEINIKNYEVVSRRDRHEGANRGGVITL